MANGAPEIVYGFFCEHARPEGGGKVTAIGLWGDICKVKGGPPSALPNLGLHVYLRNPQQIAFDTVVLFHVPGVDKPVELKFKLDVVEGAVGNNICVNMANLPLVRSGKIVARVTIMAEPPVEREFALNIQFVLPATAEPTGNLEEEMPAK